MPTNAVAVAMGGDDDALNADLLESFKDTVKKFSSPFFSRRESGCVLIYYSAYIFFPSKRECRFSR